MNRLRDLANVLLQVLPTSGAFGLKRIVLTAIGVEIASGSSVNGHTWFYGPGTVQIGEHTWIGPGARFHASAGTTIAIGDRCDIAPEVSFVTGTHVLGDSARRAGRGYAQSISIGDGCWLGTRCTILGGVTIGSGSVVAAGSVVRDTVPANSLVAGVPARVKKTLDS